MKNWPDGKLEPIINTDPLTSISLEMIIVLWDYFSKVIQCNFLSKIMKDFHISISIISIRKTFYWQEKSNLMNISTWSAEFLLLGKATQLSNLQKNSSVNAFYFIKKRWKGQISIFSSNRLQLIFGWSHFYDLESSVCLSFKKHQIGLLFWYKETRKDQISEEQFKNKTQVQIPSHYCFFRNKIWSTRVIFGVIYRTLMLGFKNQFFDFSIPFYPFLFMMEDPFKFLSNKVGTLLKAMHHRGFLIFKNPKSMDHLQAVLSYRISKFLFLGLFTLSVGGFYKYNQTKQELTEHLSETAFILETNKKIIISRLRKVNSKFSAEFANDSSFLIDTQWKKSSIFKCFNQKGIIKHIFLF